MANTIDMICKCRDALRTDKIMKLQYFAGTCGLFDKTTERINQEIVRKAKDHSRELDFTAQDLREWALDIRGILKYMDQQIEAKRCIKLLLKEAKQNGGRVQFDEFSAKHVLPYINVRRETIAGLYRTLSIIEHHSVYLYFLEEIAHDDFTLQYTERFAV